jgi:pimeloyl-ACP methyl ester carboxylesterase
VNASPWTTTLCHKTARSKDGTLLAYDCVGKGDNALVLANGLGGRLYAWEPLLLELWKDYRLITWDYRGLFDSGTPDSHRRLSVPHHVDDAIGLLDAEGVKRAVFVGWSMGVQVSLDLAATYPERVAGLVLLNGTYGQVLSTGFQPLFSVPFLPKRLHAALEWLLDHPQMAHSFASISRYIEIPTRMMLSLTAGRRANGFGPMLRRYMDDVLGPSFANFLRLFQELDAHSVYHVLPMIQAPALVISGMFDIMTPAYQSREIARRLPNAQRIALKRSSHFSLLERPEVVVPAVREFLNRRARFEG